MIAAYICAGLGFASMYLYAIRTGHFWGIRSWPERIMSLCITLLLLTLAVGYIDVAHNQDSLLWRQWLIFFALTALSVSLAWPWKNFNPTHKPSSRP